MENPQSGTRIIEELGDSRWAGWTKMEYTVKSQSGKKAVVHYVAKWEDGIIVATCRTQGLVDLETGQVSCSRND